jgi:hypothetical protein
MADNSKRLAMEGGCVAVSGGMWIYAGAPAQLVLAA